MLQTKKGRSQSSPMRLSANGRSLLIPACSWLSARREKVREISLSSICDYELSHDKKLVLYTFDQSNAVAQWKRVKKLKAIDISEMDTITRQLLLAKIKEMVRTNQQLGIRKQRWYYISMPVCLEFG